MTGPGATDQEELAALSRLAIFKLWGLPKDLKGDHGSWCEAFDASGIARDHPLGRSVVECEEEFKADPTRDVVPLG